MKRLLTIVVTLFFTQMVFGQFSGEGAGTESDPYKICTAVQLDQIRNFENSGVVFELMNDIDMYDYLLENTGKSGWQPITLFKGVLKGNNHIIKGLYASKEYSVDSGIYSFIKKVQYATIKDLGLEYIQDVSCYQGALLCLAAEKSSIEGCFIKAKMISCKSSTFGGLINTCYSSSIKNNVLMFDSIVMSKNSHAGGLCAELFSSNCIGNSVKGNVICPVYKENISWFVGGLIGEISYDPTLTVYPDVMICDNKFEGKVVGQKNVGGLVGYTGNSSTKDYQCVIKRNLVVGDVFGEQSQSIGGLCGWSVNGEYTYNVVINDTIFGNKYSGYLCGYYGSSNHTVSNNRRLVSTKKYNGYVGGTYKQEEPTTLGQSLLKNERHIHWIRLGL